MYKLLNLPERLREAVHRRSRTAWISRWIAAVITHVGISLTLGGLLIGGAALVYMTGGTSYAYPYIMLAIVAISAALYRITGGIISAVVAGLLLGPYMPLDTYTGEMQSTTNWLIRLGFYIALGGVIGGLFSLVATINSKHAASLRRDVRTRLANSAALDFDLGQMLARLPPEQTVQLTYIELNDLHDVLDTLGPDAADEAVRVISSRIRREVDAPVRLYRFSVADIVVLETQRSGTDPMGHISAIKRACLPLFEIGTVPLKLGVCMGSVQARGDGPDADTVLRRARIALASAREDNQMYRLYDDGTQARIDDLVRVITGVRNGLEKNEFLLHYQPKLCLESGQPVGCEALIRWQPGGGKLVPPGQFMPKVESTHLIDPVTRFVVQEACNFLVTLPVDHRLSINFSARNLLDDELIAWLPQALKQQQIEPERLEIEITERALVGDPGRAVEIIKELRTRGFHVSIDDFGTGYSSFEYLNDLPVTGLKIDRVFVQRLSRADNRASRSILKAMIELGQALDLELVAEGIEESQELDTLVALGVGHAQGFYFCRPKPSAAYREWLSGAAPVA